MKLPNGYGSVYKLPGNRRKPWAVRITVSRSKDSIGAMHWKYKYLGYYESRPEALNALANYNQNPYDLDSTKTTFSEIYEKWSSEHYPKISDSNVRAYKASYRLCNPLDGKVFTSLRKIDLQAIVDASGKNYPTLQKLKVLLNQLYKYAMQNDLCGKDYSQYVDISQYRNKNDNAITRKPFSTVEIETLWQQKDNEWISIILMLIYCGCRISELLELRKENVNLQERWFDILAAKTKAGVRKVPIAARTLPLFEYWYNKNDSEYLLSALNTRSFTYKNYYDTYWTPIMRNLGMQHFPHDTRHTCVSLLSISGTDDKIIRRIVGHESHSVTDSVYTHFDFQKLLDAIDKI